MGRRWGWFERLWEGGLVFPSSPPPHPPFPSISSSPFKTATQHNTTRARNEGEREGGGEGGRGEGKKRKKKKKIVRRKMTEGVRGRGGEHGSIDMKGFDLI